MNRVNGKVALVTGGTLGIGKASAEMLAKEGAKVVVSDINEKGEAVVAHIKKAGGEAIFVRHDVASESGWEKTIDATLKKFGRLDIVVNNAGVAISKTIEETTLEDWRWLMSINLEGVFLGTKLGILAMKKNETGGSIINLSSIEGIIGDPKLAAYNASKGGVRLLTKSAALHCAKAGYKIRVNSIHPAYIWTPMVENYINSTGNPEKVRKAIEHLHPLGHIGEPDDIACGVLYLASDESKFVTGTELLIDGGYTAQ
jgi:NAD(P)-dependent dehydrogenase (short-subunit alcohol dehydrogenase family)